MKGYSMFNKIKIWFSLLRVKIEDYIYPDMSYTLNQYWLPSHKNELFNDHLNTYINQNHLWITDKYSKLSNDYKKTYVIDTCGLDPKEAENQLRILISDYNEKINWDEESNEIVFKSNKKEDLN